MLYNHFEYIFTIPIILLIIRDSLMIFGVAYEFLLIRPVFGNILVERAQCLLLPNVYKKAAKQ